MLHATEVKKETVRGTTFVVLTCACGNVIKIPLLKFYGQGQAKCNVCHGKIQAWSHEVIGSNREVSDE